MKNILFITFLLFTTISNAQWVQKGNDLDGAASDDRSGISVAYPDSNTIGIGAQYNDGNGTRSGHTRVFRWHGSVWVQKGLDIDGESAYDFSGTSISMPDSNSIAIGATGNDGSFSGAGHVRIYHWNGAAWVQKGSDIDGEGSGDDFGFSVSMPDSSTVAIGAPKNDGNGTISGHAQVYRWNGNSWIQKGMDLDGEATFNYSGWSVSMADSNTLAIGAPGNDGNGTRSGHVRVYQWNGTAWNQKGTDIDGESAGDDSGYSISMGDSNTIAIGAPKNSAIGTEAGHLRVFRWNGTAWQQKGLDIDGEAANDESGSSVSMLDSNTLAIGAPGNSGNGSASGHVRIYEWNGSAWIQKGQDLDGENGGDNFGIAVDMSSHNTVAIGTPFNDDFAYNAGHVRLYRDSTFTVGVRKRISNKNRFSIYPNPSSDYFFFEADQFGVNDELIIHNMQGRITMRRTIDQNRQRIETDNWTAGIYFLRYGEEIVKLVLTR